MDPCDFIVAGALLFATGIACKLITGRSTNTIYRVAAGLTLLAGLFLIWADLAVGIFGS